MTIKLRGNPSNSLIPDTGDCHGNMMIVSTERLFLLPRNDGKQLARNDGNKGLAITVT